MGRRRNAGLVKRGQVWHIDKTIGGRRVCQSTGTTSLGEAEQYLARLVEQDRQATVYGVRPERTFEQAAAKYVQEQGHKRSLESDIGRLKGLMPTLGPVPLSKLHMGVMQPWVAARQASGVSPGTINHGLKVVRRILNLAASEWVDEYGLTWLAVPPKIRLLPDRDKRQPYPLKWDEQRRLFAALPSHLARMALFAVNTGCRDGEVCHLRWEWEVRIPELGTSIFRIPGTFVKNGDAKIVVLNRVALSVVDSVRGQHPEYVFSYKGKPTQRMLNSAWVRARRAVGLFQVRVHDLRHTFGKRLRAAGVSYEDRQDLLGHRSGRITDHYSAAELSKLMEAANRICAPEQESRELIVRRDLRAA